MPNYRMKGLFFQIDSSLEEIEPWPESIKNPDVICVRRPIPKSTPVLKGGKPSFHRDGDVIHLHIPGRVSILLHQGRLIEYEPEAGISDQIALRVVLTKTFELILMQRDGFILHASAVGFPHGKAAILIGPSGTGKSTLAAALARQNNHLVTDDMAAIDYQAMVPRVLPLESRARLLPDAVGRLSETVMENPGPAGTKLILPLTPWPYRVPPTVGALFLLRRGTLDDDSIPMHRLPADQAGAALYRHSRYSPVAEQLFGDRAQWFERNLRNLDGVPIYTMTLPNGWKRYADVMNFISAAVQ